MSTYYIPSRIPVVEPLPATTAPTGTDPSLFSTYDVAIGGLGFRYASTSDKPVVWETAPFVRNQIDTANEPGEQTLTNWWPKSQASWHGGAGNLNMERVDLPPEYTHIRFDSCLGVNIWTPGKLTRLPDTHFLGFGFTPSASAAATVGGVDYAIVGGVGGLYQAAWNAGPDVAPTVTAIDLAGSNFGGASNVNVTSLCTDGLNYYGVLQMTTVGFVATVLTYIIKGQVNSSAQPVALYEVPNSNTGISRHNLCTNPSFETDAAGWAGSGTPTPTVARSLTRAFVGSASLLVTSTGAATFLPNAQIGLPTVVGTTYTFSCYVYVPTGTPNVVLLASTTPSVFGSTATVKDAWVRLSVTFKATATTTPVGVECDFTAVGQTFYIDAVLAEVGSTVGSYFDGSTATAGGYTFSWDGTVNDSASTGIASALVSQVPSIVGWQKARLVGGIGSSLYELDTGAAAHSALPSPRYTHPSSSWTWSAVAEAPTQILAAGYIGGQAAVLGFTLDSSEGTPFLAGGNSVYTPALGELIYAMVPVSGSFLGLGTTKGIRVGTYETYTGHLKIAPLSVETTRPVSALTTRDRFLYGSYTNQQQDGKSGLVAVDVTTLVDQQGRNAYAPDIRPATAAPTGVGNVACAVVLPNSRRLFFTTPEGFHTEGSGAGTDGDAWLKTSRIRYGTTEPKLFKLGRIRGNFDAGTVRVDGITRTGSSSSATIGFTLSDPDEFVLPDGRQEWLQLKFTLSGTGVELRAWGVKALPGTKRQRLIRVTCSAADRETDRAGHRTKDIGSARTRVESLFDIDAAGDEVYFEEFGIYGSKRTLVTIDKVTFTETARPTRTSDFGGEVTVLMRTVT